MMYRNVDKNYPNQFTTQNARNSEIGAKNLYKNLGKKINISAVMSYEAVQTLI